MRNLKSVAILAQGPRTPNLCFRFGSGLRGLEVPVAIWAQGPHDPPLGCRFRGCSAAARRLAPVIFSNKVLAVVMTQKPSQTGWQCSVCWKWRPAEWTYCGPCRPVGGALPSAGAPSSQRSSSRGRRSKSPARRAAWANWTAPPGDPAGADGAQASRTRSTSSARRRRRKGTSAGTGGPQQGWLPGSWEQQQVVLRLREASAALRKAGGDAEQVQAVEQQLQLAEEMLWDAQPAAARLEHHRKCTAALEHYCSELVKLQDLQRTKLARTLERLTKAREDWAIARRKVQDLEDQGTAEPMDATGADGWDEHWYWDYDHDEWSWDPNRQDRKQLPPPPPPPGQRYRISTPPVAVTADPYGDPVHTEEDAWASDGDLADSLVKFLAEVHGAAQTASPAAAQTASLLAAAVAGRAKGRTLVSVKSDPATPLRSASQTSTVPYSPPRRAASVTFAGVGTPTQAAAHTPPARTPQKMTPRASRVETTCLLWTISLRT